MHLGYKISFINMAFSAILGVRFHIALDAPFEPEDAPVFSDKGQSVLRFYLTACIEIYMYFIFCPAVLLVFLELYYETAIGILGETIKI